MQFKILGKVDMDAARKQGVCVCVSDGEGLGVALNCVGVCRLEAGKHSALLVDLGLDDAPLGLSIWEGTYVVLEHLDGDFDTEPSGKFRDPTQAELDAFLTKRDPWPEHWR